MDADFGNNFFAAFWTNSVESSLSLLLIFCLKFARRFAFQVR
jgi:hypothetical protein